MEKLLAKVKDKKRRTKLSSEMDKPLSPWQKELVEELEGDINPRTIIWIVHPEGNKGKSWLTKYLCTQKPTDCIMFGNAKTADILYAFRGQRMALFDFCRSQEDHLNYMAIESIKNACYFSSKGLGYSITPSPPGAQRHNYRKRKL